MNNKIKQREFYKGLRERHDEHRTGPLRCQQDECDVILKEISDPFKGAEGEKYCSIDCLNRDIT